MKKLITLAAIAAILSVSACKKAEATTEEPATQQNATETVTEAAPAVEAAVEAPAEAKAE